ncbi:hypothetical protein DIPPA_30085 [Diplonema papillatum]|nr:hypothetical protein DIPPA_30085 [Diplonema papillatum]
MRGGGMRCIDIVSDVARYEKRTSGMERQVGVVLAYLTGLLGDLAHDGHAVTIDAARARCIAHCLKRVVPFLKTYHSFMAAATSRAAQAEAAVASLQQQLDEAREPGQAPQPGASALSTRGVNTDCTVPPSASPPHPQLVQRFAACPRPAAARQRPSSAPTGAQARPKAAAPQGCEPQDAAARRLGEPGAGGTPCAAPLRCWNPGGGPLHSAPGGAKGGEGARDAPLRGSSVPEWVEVYYASLASRHTTLASAVFVNFVAGKGDLVFEVHGLPGAVASGAPWAVGFADCFLEGFAGHLARIAGPAGASRTERAAGQDPADTKGRAVRSGGIDLLRGPADARGVAIGSNGADDPTATQGGAVRSNGIDMLCDPADTQGGAVRRSNGIDVLCDPTDTQAEPVRSDGIDVLCGPTDTQDEAVRSNGADVLRDPSTLPGQPNSGRDRETRAERPGGPAAAARRDSAAASDGRTPSDPTDAPRAQPVSNGRLGVDLRAQGTLDVACGEAPRSTDGAKRPETEERTDGSGEMQETREKRAAKQGSAGPDQNPSANEREQPHGKNQEDQVWGSHGRRSWMAGAPRLLVAESAALACNPEATLEAQGRPSSCAAAQGASAPEGVVLIEMTDRPSPCRSGGPRAETSAVLPPGVLSFLADAAAPPSIRPGSAVSQAPPPPGGGSDVRSVLPAASRGSGSGLEPDAAGTQGFYLSGDEPGACIEIRTGDAFVTPTAYGLSSKHPLYGGHQPRNWALFGAMVGSGGEVRWVLLRSHAGDESTQSAGAACCWSIDGVAKRCRAAKELPFFNAFRLGLTGPDALGSHRLQISSFELYGRVLTARPRLQPVCSVTAPVDSLAFIRSLPMEVTGPYPWERDKTPPTSPLSKSAGGHSRPLSSTRAARNRRSTGVKLSPRASNLLARRQTNFSSSSLSSSHCCPPEPPHRFFAPLPDMPPPPSAKRKKKQKGRR